MNALRPYQGFAAIQQEQSNGGSNYHSLQASLQRTKARNISFGVSYTFSKSMDDSSNYRDIVPDTYYTGNLYGPSEFDARHMAVVNFVYALPFFRSRIRCRARFLAAGASRAWHSSRPAALAPARTLPGSASTAALAADRKASSG